MKEEMGSVGSVGGEDFSYPEKLFHSRQNLG
jgi:hypothetical protein